MPISEAPAPKPTQPEPTKPTQTADDGMRAFERRTTPTPSSGASLADGFRAFERPLDPAPADLVAQQELAEVKEEVRDFKNTFIQANPARVAEEVITRVDKEIYHALWEDPDPPEQPLGHKTWGGKGSLTIANLAAEKEAEERMLADGLEPTGDGIQQWQVQVVDPVAAHLKLTTDGEPNVPSTRTDDPQIPTKDSATDM